MGWSGRRRQNRIGGIHLWDLAVIQCWRNIVQGLSLEIPLKPKGIKARFLLLPFPPKCQERLHGRFIHITWFAQKESRRAQLGRNESVVIITNLFPWYT